MDNFDNAFEHIVGLEGGYVNDPKDPGGETNYGISKRAYPDVDIKALTLDQAKGIYRRDYWNAVKADQLPWPLAAYVFDCAVNQGASVAILLLQKTLGVKMDGILGQHTLAAVRKGDQQELASLYMAQRALRYTGTRNFDRFGLGWMKRLFKITTLTR